MLSVLMGMGAQELKNIKVRTKSVIEHRAKSGYALGKAPVGYLNVRTKDKRGIIVPNEAVRHHIVRAFELYATGLFSMERIGTFPSELIRHFFRSFAEAARCNLYLSARAGGDSHHTAEALFKAFARAMRKAVRRIPGDSRIPSTKGLL